MKHLFLFALLMVSLLWVPAQSWEKFNATASVNALLNEKLISPTEKEYLLGLLDDHTINSFEDPNTPEGLLYQVYRVRSDSSLALGADYYDLLYSGAPFAEVVADARVRRYYEQIYGAPAPDLSFFDAETYLPLKDSIAARARLWAAALERAGLVSPAIAQSPDLIGEEIFDGQSFLYRLSNWVRIERRNPEIRAAEIQKARSLVEAGVMPEDQFKHLQFDFKAGEVKGEFGLLDYCNYALAIRSEKTPEDVVSFMRELTQKIADQMPEKGISNIRVTKEMMHFPDIYYVEGMDQEFIVVYLDYQGKTYAQAFMRGEEGVSLGDMVLSDYIQLFNKVLSDAGSYYRLHSVYRYSHSEYADPDAMGCVFLTETQWLTWDDLIHNDTLLYRINPFSALSYENYEDAMTPSRLHGFFSELESAGFMDHLSTEEKNKCWDLLWKTNPSDFTQVVLAVPGLVYPIPYYLPGESAPYAGIITDLAKYSHGSFSPTKITDGYKTGGGDFAVSFKLRKKYKTTVSYGYDATDFNFFSFVRDCVEKGNTGKKLYFAQGESCMIWLNDDQYQTMMRLCPELFDAGGYYEGE